MDVLRGLSETNVSGPKMLPILPPYSLFINDVEISKLSEGALDIELCSNTGGYVGVSVLSAGDIGVMALKGFSGQFKSFRLWGVSGIVRSIESDSIITNFCSRHATNKLVSISPVSVPDSCVEFGISAVLCLGGRCNFDDHLT